VRLQLRDPPHRSVRPFMICPLAPGVSCFPADTSGARKAVAQCKSSVETGRCISYATILHEARNRAPRLAQTGAMGLERATLRIHHQIKRKLARFAVPTPFRAMRWLTLLSPSLSRLIPRIARLQCMNFHIETLANQ
jgi:hypothetical protein